jgi:predicted enzyme related to lactoylglutathione lyase
MAESTASAASGASAPFAEGAPCWVDAQLSDVEAGKRFYGDLFGWTFEAAYSTPRIPRVPRDPRDATAERSSSVWAYRDGESVAALVPKRDGRMPTVWTVYFATPDAAALVERIRTAGGQVITEAVPVDSLGTPVLAADPQGAVFGLWQPDSHPGFGRHHEPGSFCWAELYDREPADDFYEEVFDSGRQPDVGRAAVSDVFPVEMPPHFLVHFGVPECEAALETVQRLGGRVQKAPFDTSYGRVAVVTDNQGASFAVLQR